MASEPQSSGADRRRDARYPVNVRATLSAYRQPTVAALLVDVSASGGLLQTQGHGFRVGDEVFVRAEVFEAVATVAWTRDAELGVSFHRHLDASKIITLSRTGRA